MRNHFVQDIELLATEHSKHNNEASNKCNEANERVNDRVDLQDNDDPITSMLGDSESRIRCERAACRFGLAFVLKGQLEARSKLEHFPVLNLHIHLHNLGDAQVP